MRRSILLEMHTTIAEFVRTTVLIIAALFPIVNPLCSAPIFLTMTRGCSPETRRSLALKIALNGLLLLAGSIFFGTNILDFFGISIPVVQVGGGMVVIASGWSLLNRGEDDERRDEEASGSAAAVAQRAFYPLTLPLTVGPGSISVAITVGANRPPASETRWAYLTAAILGVVVVAITIYLSYRFAEVIARVLGEAAMNVILRLSSFILVCIGVQIAWNGVSTLLHSVLGH